MLGTLFRQIAAGRLASNPPGDQVHPLHEHLAPRLDGLSLTAGERRGWKSGVVLCPPTEERKKEVRRGKEWSEEEKRRVEWRGKVRSGEEWRGVERKGKEREGKEMKGEKKRGK